MQEHLHHEYVDPETFREHHATYTPATIVAQAALTATPGTSLLTGTNGVIYVMRTIQVSTPSAGKTFTLSIGADAAGTRIYEAYALTANVPLTSNGWWVFTGGGAAEVSE